MLPQPSSFRVSPEQGDVSALLLRPADAIAILVLAHSAGVDMRHRSMQTLAEGLAEQRIATFRYNFPYKEKGSGRPDTKPVATATVRAAVAAAASAAPDLPLFAGGRSFGGRMTSLAISQEALPNVHGIVFFAFPLHPTGKPSIERADHLYDVNIPMMFLQGPRDALATPDLLEPIVEQLGAKAMLHTLAGADHSFHVLKSSGRTDAEVLGEAVEVSAAWMQGLLP